MQLFGFPDEPAEFAGETDIVDAALVVRRPDGDDGLEDARSIRAATAKESLDHLSCMCLDNSSMGVACVEPASAAVASLASVCSSPCPLVACVAGAVHARRTVA